MLNTRIKIHEKNILKNATRKTKKFMNFLLSGYMIQTKKNHKPTINQP